MGDFAADLLDLGVGGVGVVFEEVGAAWGLLASWVGLGLVGELTVGDEVDWGFGHVGGVGGIYGGCL